MSRIPIIHRMKKRGRKVAVASLVAMILAASAVGCGNVQAVSGSSDTAVTTNSGEASENTDTTNATDTTNSTDTTDTASSDGSTLITSAADLDYSDMFTERDLSGAYDESEATIISLSDSGITADGDGADSVEIDGTTLTITAAGTYIVSGTLSDGQIVVDADDENDKVQIVLNGVTITNDDSACILVKAADKVFITLADGSQNSLSDTGAEYVQADDSVTVDGVIFAKSDLVLNGSGALTVNASYSNAVVSKDDLKVTGGTYTITATGKGLSGKDSVRIAGGDFAITSDDDSIHSSNDDESGKGYVYIEGGTFTISSGDDGIHAATALIIEDGEINILESKEGLEGDTVDIDGGNIVVNSSDDGINAAMSSSTENSSSFPENGGGAPSGERPSGENSSSERPSGERPSGENPSGEKTSSEVPEGENPSGEKPSSEVPEGNQMPGDGQMPGGGMMDSQPACYIHITGGTITVNAAGDGVDSNGSIVVDGGTLTVYGPTDNGNGAIDYGTTATVNGGTVVAAGSSGMATGFASDSAQYSFLYYFSEILEAGTEVTVTDSTGNVVISAVPEKAFSSIVISTADLEAGEYTITAGDQSDTITLSEMATTIGNGGMGMR